MYHIIVAQAGQTVMYYLLVTHTHMRARARAYSSDEPHNSGTDNYIRNTGWHRQVLVRYYATSALGTKYFEGEGRWGSLGGIITYAS